MVFIIKKKIKGKDYYYLRKSERKGGKVKSVNIAYLGKNKEEAEEKMRKIVSGEKSLNDTEKKERNMDNKKEKEDGFGIDELAMFCKRKGFVYPSGEIYGGLGGFWDFGHLGVELKNNIKREWWKFYVQQREDMTGIDGSIITNPKVWEASGHVASFVDVAVVCKKCGNKKKVDKHEVGKIKCEKCGGEFLNKGEFNPMFVTNVGPIKEDSVKAYLRPETAQLIFANFKNVQENARMQLPFGIAQIGKAFRNELSPREFMFRCREFEQMEIEYFIDKEMKCPYMNEIKDIELAIFSEEMQKKDEKPKVIKIYDAWKKGLLKRDWHAYWMAMHLKWFVQLGAKAEKFRARQHHSEERSHYSSDTWDLEYEFPMGWRELEGFADRSNYDLTQHQKYSGKSMEMQDKDGKKVLPEVVCEPSLGVERAFIVFMLGAYEYDKKRENIVLKLNPRLAPIKTGVFPIVKGEEYEKIAKGIVRELRKEWNIGYDNSGSIGRRYARMDEAGTPLCITIDEESLKDKSVTIRDRDTTEQVRVKISELGEIIRNVVNGVSVLEFGKLVETRVK
jgi:glycyl-tRNA synthetase